MFSVVIPTLQRSADLGPLVELCAEHPLVLEVLVINNAPEPLDRSSPKVRVLDQDGNIFVNPAWNLGAREARGEYLAIINDDMRFDPELIDEAAAVISRPGVGILGIDGAFLNRPRAARTQIRFATYEHVTLGFGMAMFMRRTNYFPIPSELKIWGGDDWLFLKQRWPNRVIIGPRVETEVSVTSGAAEFQRMRQQELEIANRLIGPLRGTRWWHLPSSGLARLRSRRGRLLASARRSRSARPQ